MRRQLQNYLAEKLQPRGIEAAAFLDSVQKEFNQIYGYFEQGETPRTHLTELLEQATREAADNTVRLVGSVQEMLQHAATGQPIQQMLKQHSDLEEAVNCDPLTGALNREGFNARAADMLNNASRYASGLAVVYLDIDRFKTLNDAHGHAAGDAALEMVVDTIKKSIRQADIVARLGGDEFVILATDCSDAGAMTMVERVLTRIADQPVSEDAPPARLTLECRFPLGRQAGLSAGDACRLG